MAIPKIIHQIWIGNYDEFPEKYHNAMHSWRTQYHSNKGYVICNIFRQMGKESHMFDI